MKAWPASKPPSIGQKRGMGVQIRALPDLVDRLGSTKALDGPATVLSSLIKKFAKGPVKDVASGSWLGHPLHPTLVAIPIGSWTGALVLDLTTGKGSAKAARRLVGLGVLAALPTAFSGASDFSDTMGAERRVGLVHAVGAWTSIGLYAASWRARARGRGRGTALALAGGGALAATGYLGGHLSYDYGVGVNTNAFETGPQDWTGVAAENDVVEGKLWQAHADGVAILLTRRNGELHAIGDRCSHRGGPLSEGELDGDCVVCPWHGSRFRLADGEVSRGPASMPQPTYDVRVSDGQILVRRSEERALRTNPV